MPITISNNLEARIHIWQAKEALKEMEESFSVVNVIQSAIVNRMDRMEKAVAKLPKAWEPK